MDGLYSFRTLLTKVLALIGFVVFIGLFIALIFLGVSKAPSVFASLAATLERIGAARPIPELEETPLTLAVTSATLAVTESTILTWNEPSRFLALEATCAQENTFDVAFESSTSTLPLVCNTPIMVPETATSARLTLLASPDGITDTVLSLSNTETNVRTMTTLTLLGSVAAPSTTPDIGTETDNTSSERESIFPIFKQPKPPMTETDSATTTRVPSQTPAPVVTPAPTGPDLAVRFTHVGRVVNNTFVFTSTYTEGARNATRVRIQNFGDSTSAPWSVVIQLPDGTRYRSQIEAPLRPGEYADFILDFTLQNVSGVLGTIETTITTSKDTDTSNNTSRWSVYVN